MRLLTRERRPSKVQKMINKTEKTGCVVKSNELALIDTRRCIEANLDLDIPRVMTLV